MNEWNDKIRCLYLCSIDISIPNGPGVNEAEFVPALNNVSGGNSYFLLPFPEGQFPPGLPASKIAWVASVRKGSVISWLTHKTSLLYHAIVMVRKHRPDLIVMRLGVFSVAEFLLTCVFARNTPYAIKTAGDGTFPVFDRKTLVVRALKPVNHWIHRILVRRAIAVDVVSPAQQQRLQEMAGRDANVIWVDNGVNTERFSPICAADAKARVGLPGNAFVIGYAGNFPVERGVEQLVNVVKRLAKEGWNIHGLVVGEDEATRELAANVMDCGYQEQFSFVGQVPYTDVPNYMGAMDLGMSLRRGNLQSASELKVRQYIACGKPVLVSPGVNEFVMESGIGRVVDPDDMDEIQEAVLHYMRLSPEEYAQVSRRARDNAVAHLSYEAKVKERVALWQGLLKKSRVSQGRTCE